MATEDVEGNNFLAELKNVLQRFNTAKDPNFRTPLQSEGDRETSTLDGTKRSVIGNGTCGGRSRFADGKEAEKISDDTGNHGRYHGGMQSGSLSLPQSRHPSGSPAKDRLPLALSLAPSMDSLRESAGRKIKEDFKPLSPYLAWQPKGGPQTPRQPLKEFFPRSPQLTAVAIPLSPKLVDETEYPPKSPPKTVFQHYPKPPKTPEGMPTGSALDEGATPPNTTPKPQQRFTFTTTEISPSSKTSHAMSVEDREKDTSILTKAGLSGSLSRLSPETMSPTKTPELPEKGDNVLAKQDLYNELNNVLRRRNEKGHQPLQFEKMKTGKSVVYYGRGGHGLGDESQPQTPMSIRSEYQWDRDLDSSFEHSNVSGLEAYSKDRKKKSKTQSVDGSACQRSSSGPDHKESDRESIRRSSENQIRDSHGNLHAQSPTKLTHADNIKSLEPKTMCHRSASDFKGIVDELNFRYCRDAKESTILNGEAPCQLSGHHFANGNPDNVIYGDKTALHVHHGDPAAMVTAADDNAEPCVDEWPDEWPCGGDLPLSVCPADKFSYKEVDDYPTLPIRSDVSPGDQIWPSATDPTLVYNAKLPPLPRVASVIQTQSEKRNESTLLRRNLASQAKLKKTASAPSGSPCKKTTQNGGVGCKYPLPLQDISSSDVSYSASDTEATLSKLTRLAATEASQSNRMSQPQGSHDVAGGSDGSLTMVTSSDNSGCERVKKTRSFMMAPGNAATAEPAHCPGHVKANSWHSLMFVTGADTWIHRFAAEPEMEDSYNNNQSSLPQLDVDHSGIHKKEQKIGSFGRFRPNLVESLFHQGNESTQGGKAVRGNHLPTKISNKKKWGKEGSINLRKSYATFPPPRWTRATGVSKDDDVIATLMITHSGDRLPSDTDEKKKKKVDSRQNCISANVTVPLPTSFHLHGNDVGHHLIHPAGPMGTEDMSSPEPDYDLKQMESDFKLNPMNLCEDHLLDDDHKTCNVCLSLADKTLEKIRDTEDDDTEDQNAVSNEYETECSTGADSRGMYPSLDDDHIHFSKHLSLDKETHRCMLYHTWSSSAAKRAHDRLRAQPWNIRRGMTHIEGASDSSAHFAKQWCKSSDALCGRSSSQAQLIGQSDSYSSDEVTVRAEKQAAKSNSLEKNGSGKQERSYSIANSIQSMCTYIMDSYDHGSDADTESLYQDYDAYEKSLIQYVKTEDLSQINDDIRSLYWQQLDTISLGALHIQQRSMLHKFICCFVCNQRFHKRSRNKAAKRCPLTQNITDGGSVDVFGDGLTNGIEGKPAVFYVDPKGKRGDLWVQVDGPNSIAKCNIEPDNAGRYSVSYIPVESGVYVIHVKWNGRPVPGSPFHPNIVDTSKVVMVGGWQSLLDAHDKMSLTVNEVKRIEFNTSAAGAGVLTAELRGPGGTIVPCELERVGDGRYIVSCVPRMEGEHFLSVWLSKVLLPRFPIAGYAYSAQASINSEKVILTGHGLQTAQIRNEAEFVIDGTEAGPGQPEVKLTGVKEDISVSVSPLAGRANCYRCSYIPRLAGAYLLNIMWSDRQVRGSPFKVTVSAGSDATKVLCSGEGLKVGIMGKEIKSVIDTRRAGPGELEAHCMGPKKVAYCELFDHHDGTFTLNIKPQEPGRHILQVKYGGEHVPGSPYTLRVSSAPDASKVRVSGPGIEHGILAMFQSYFTVETRGAGAGQLTVRIRGPKGAFRVEMSRDSQKDRTIRCNFDPTEVGDYVIYVKWSGEEVPGSPYRVQIFDTQEELEAFMVGSGHRLNTLPSTNRSWESRTFDM